MNKKEINQISSERLEVKYLKGGQEIEFTINGFTHKVVVVGILNIDNSIHDVLVKEIEQSGNLELLSSYDSNFYQREQKYIEVDFYTDDED